MKKLKSKKGKMIMAAILKAFLVLLFLLCIFILCVFMNHKIQSYKDAALLTPSGQLVNVNGSNMSIYTEGSGDKTIVFMSGGGTPLPILDFRSLYSLLNDEYKIIVVEKFGYGFSDDSDRSREIDTMLEDTRQALAKAGMGAPYILCPHSMSGLEALYWAQKYPDEVSAIIGLDMAVPEYYADMDISTVNLKLKLNKVLSKIGIVRLLSNQYINTLYAKSALTEADKEVIKALYSQRCVSTAFINECEKCLDNSKVVSVAGVPNVPMLLFLSDGTGTGFDKQAWRSIAIDYISQADNGLYIELDCPHYVHNYEYEKIADEIRKYTACAFSQRWPAGFLGTAAK